MNECKDEMKERRSGNRTYHASCQVGQSLFSGTDVLLGRASSAASSPTKGGRASGGVGRHLGRLTCFDSRAWRVCLSVWQIILRLWSKRDGGKMCASQEQVVL